MPCPAVAALAVGRAAVAALAVGPSHLDAVELPCLANVALAVELGMPCLAVGPLGATAAAPCLADLVFLLLLFVLPVSLLLSLLLLLL